jgi:uncharacterized phage protein gp47/JayE
MGFAKKGFQELRDTILDDIVSKGLITDRNVGGVTRTLVEAYARELATLYESMHNVYESGFVDTAGGKSLDFVVSILDIERIDAEQAVGAATFARQTPAQGDIAIVKGTVITGQRHSAEEEVPFFETTANRTLQQGSTSVEVPIRARDRGEAGLVGPNELTVLPRPIVGIETVFNREATTLRVRQETDQELRERARNALRNTGKATADALEFALRRMGVESVEIIDQPGGKVGEIEIYVDGKALDDDQRQAEIKTIINSTKAAGIKAHLYTADRIHIFLKLRLTLKQPVMVPEELQNILEDVAGRIEAYVASLGLGERVRKNGFVAAAMGNSEVVEVEFLPPEESVPDLLFRTGRIENAKRIYDEEAPTRKRVLDGGDIFIDKQERAALNWQTDLIPNQDLIVRERKFSVFVDFNDPALVLSGDPAVSQRQIIDRLRTAIEDFFSQLDSDVNVNAIAKERERQRAVTLDYKTLCNLLAVQGYTIAASKLKIVLLHDFDGLENTLRVPGERDILKANEVAQLRNLDLQINIEAATKE